MAILTAIKERLKSFFFPPPGSPPWVRILPYAVLGVLTIVVLSGGVYGWDYTNSPQFCGTTCHTMPPQDATYQISPHANVYCTECHIGRAFVGTQFARKSEDVREIYAMVFNTYEFPIRATRSNPARVTCERCHQPETFSGDSLRTITHFGDDAQNTPQTTYLILKTGGGAKREGLGRGIHWHIVNQVEYYATDNIAQNIPFVRVHNEDGTTTDYIDVESGFDPATLNTAELKSMDCLTCHNRVTHNFQIPSVSIDEAMAKQIIDPGIPDIHRKAVEALTNPYPTHDSAVAAISALEDYYKTTDYYAGHEETIKNAVTAIQQIYDRTVFSLQKVDWTTYPNNIGHVNTPGCFRCHDGKHLDTQQQAIRLECNLCHSIPTIASSNDFITRIEISRGPEPDSHRNANWINLHNKVFDPTCANCHTTEDAGGTSNTSFCSNSACHGSAYTYAGFDAPKLREVIQSQIPTPVPTATPAPVVGTPTYDANISAILNACVMCHGKTASAGLSFLSYADTMKGGEKGPVITPGDSANSKLIQVQSGTHFSKLDASQLDLVKQWIDAGAPEK